MTADPYRVLGLPTDASLAEVKRAYRRLAKANHPDSAGAAATARFLEIQGAYEAITRVPWRPGMRRPPAPAASEPWRADSRRARATPGAEKPGAGPSGAATPGAGPPGSGQAGSRPGRRPGGAGAPGAGQGSPRGSARGSSARGSSPGGAGNEGPTGRRRPSRKATFGSTSYDEAREQADTTWSGASWYGPSSGEYWRVNPREYADPRKHGPEYQARAAARDVADARRREHGGPHPDASAGNRGGESDRDESASSSPPRPAWTHRQPPTPPPAPAPTGDAVRPGPFRLDLSPGARRLVRAMVAWPPLGIAAAAVIGDATGCAAFEATCVAPADLYPWVAQAAILLALLALPAIARVLAGGSVAVAILAFPVAAALSASGATYDRTYGPAALSAVLAVVWAGGVVAVLTRRAVTGDLP
ncbi:MAG: DnaJ domain-containing protein [Chloroflexota bacterium]